MKEHALPQDVTGYRFHIIGNMTLKQFAEVAVGCVIGFFIYSTNLPAILKWPLILLFAGAGAAAAFVPFEERPFDHWIVAFFQALYRPTQFYWKRSSKIPEPFHYKPKSDVSKMVKDVDLTPSRRQRVKEYIRSVEEKPIKDTLDNYTDTRLDEVMNIFQEKNIGFAGQIGGATSGSDAVSMPVSEPIVEPVAETIVVEAPTVVEPAVPVAVEPPKPVDTPEPPAETIPVVPEPEVVEPKKAEPELQPIPNVLAESLPEVSLETKTTAAETPTSTDVKTLSMQDIASPEFTKQTERDKAFAEQKLAEQKKKDQAQISPEFLQNKVGPKIALRSSLQGNSNQNASSGAGGNPNNSSNPNTPAPTTVSVIPTQGDNEDTPSISLSDRPTAPNPFQAASAADSVMRSSVYVPETQFVSVEHTQQQAVDTLPSELQDQTQINTSETYLSGTDRVSSNTRSATISQANQTAQQLTQQQIKNSKLPFPERPTAANKIVGMVVDPQETPLPGAIVEILTGEGLSARAVRTNPLGQFFITTPLSNGNYTITAEKDGYHFSPQQLIANGQIIEPIEVRSVAGVS